MASGTALARQANAAIAADEATSLRDAGAGGFVTAEDVAEAAAANDPLALRLMEREGEYIGIGVVNLLHLFSPQRIALGGGVMKSADLLFPAMHRIVAARAMTPYRDAEIGLPTLGDYTGVLGAAALILAKHQ